MICVPIIEREIRSVLPRAENAIKLGADILEFRIDALQNPVAEEINNLILEVDHPIIATNRMQNEGGYFKGSEEQRISILIKAARNADMVDVELQTSDKLLKKVLDTSRSVIVSYHDFKKTPSFQELLRIVKREHEIGDFAKFAVMPHDHKDTLTVLKVISEVPDTIGIAMGDIGKYTRITAPIFGSPITYASANRKSAPGQLDVQTTRDILRKLAVID